MSTPSLTKTLGTKYGSQVLKGTRVPLDHTSGWELGSAWAMERSLHRKLGRERPSRATTSRSSARPTSGETLRNRVRAGRVRRVGSAPCLGRLPCRPTFWATCLSQTSLLFCCPSCPSVACWFRNGNRPRKGGGRDPLVQAVPAPAQPKKCAAPHHLSRAHTPSSPSAKRRLLLIGLFPSFYFDSLSARHLKLHPLLAVQ